MSQSSPTEKKNLPENKMGFLPVPKLLLTVSLPMIISMLVQSLYNIIDSIFVGMLSENALAAVSLAFPIQMLTFAVGSGTAVGVNAILSRSLGERDFDRANKAAMNGIFLAIVSFLIFIFVGFFAIKPFYASQTMNADREIYVYGVQYLMTVTVCSFAVFGQLMFERLLQSTGKTFYTMITQGTGAIVNIILDPLFIFGIGPFPRLEVLGAAIATVIGQIIAAALALYFNIRFNKELHLSLSGLKPDWPLIGRIYKVGFPSIIMVSVGSVMNYGMNLILLGFSSTAAVVFGVYYKLQSFIFMPLFGLNGGIIPIVAYNYGAGKRSRMIDTIKLAVLYSEGIMALGVALFLLFPEKLLSLFSASEAMLAIGVPALRIISAHFLIAGFCIVVGSVFQALGNGVYSLVVSVMRQLVVLLPAAFLLSQAFGLDAVWWAFPIAEVMSLIASSFFFLRIKKKVIDHVPDNV
ncbi:MAG TPA: MATE family efflux transporter [Clostridiales bacterium]|nr:MATE family efflux transporter [Clostridiales bacterium]